MLKNDWQSHWWTDLVVFAVIFAFLLVAKPDLDTASRFFTGALLSAVCGFLLTFLFPKVGLEKRRLSYFIVTLGGVVAALLSLVWGVSASLVAFAVVIVAFHRRSQV